MIRYVRTLLGFILLSGAASTNSADLPQVDQRQHLGVASCASGVCHGSVNARSGSSVNLQPAHFVVDKDYIESKWAGSGLETWAIGQVESARQTLNLIENRLKTDGLFPELALFDCHACHHNKSNQKWQPSDTTNLPPGTVRLNDASFVMVLALASVVQPGLDDQVKSGLRRLHQTVAKGIGISESIAYLKKLLDKVNGELKSERLLSVSDKLLTKIIKTSSSGKMNDYARAEQAIMAIDMLLSIGGQRSEHADWLIDVYDTVENEDEFEPEAFIRVMNLFGR